MTAALSPTEHATLDRIEAAEPAEESFRERMADAMYDELDSLGFDFQSVSSHVTENLADAAIAVMRGHA